MVAAGGYVFVYLDRWEWNRAVVSGIIFLAAEMALLGTLVLDALRRSGRRRRVRRRADERVLRRLRDHAPEPAHPFAWLKGNQTNVFVPVLLGAGVVLSALAWLVDRVARLTARPSLERGLARRLATLQPEPAGSSAATSPTRSSRDEARRRPAGRRGGSVAHRRRAGRPHAEPARRGRPRRRHRARRRVDHDRFGTGDAGAAAALWAVCSAQTRSRATAPPAALGDGSFRVVLVPAVGEHEQRKLVGCLEDLTVDRVRGNVRSFEAVARSG